MVRTAAALEYRVSSLNTARIMVVKTDDGWFRFNKYLSGPDLKRRSRWRRSTHGTDPTSLIAALVEATRGPVFFEISDREHAELKEFGTVPRAVNMRFERALDGAAHSNGRVRQTIQEWIENPSGVVIAAPLTKAPQKRTMTKLAATAPASAPAKEQDMLLDYPQITKGTVSVGSATYHTRNIGRKKDVVVYREYRERGKHIISFGPSGTGKTEMVRAAFDGMMRTIICSEDTIASDLVGDFIRSGDGKNWIWKDGPLTECMEQGLPFFADEIHRARQKQLAPLFGAMDGRRELYITAGNPRTVRAAPGFAVFASANISSASGELDEALASRFNLKLSMQTDFKMAREQLGINSALVTACENLNARRLSHEIGWSPQLRDMIETQDNIELVGEPAAFGSLINSAPVKDRAAIADVLSKALGRKVEALVMA